MEKEKTQCSSGEESLCPPHLVPDLMTDTDKGRKVRRRQDGGPLEELMAGDSIPGQNVWPTSIAPSMGSIRCFT